MQYTYCTAVNIYNYNKPWFRNGVEYVININRKKIYFLFISRNISKTFKGMDCSFQNDSHILRLATQPILPL